jgi:hypothetical protein
MNVCEEYGGRSRWLRLDYRLIKHTRSKATPGTPDFWVGVAGRGLWLEFKRERSCKLSPEHEEFRSACEAQRIEHHVVYSADEAIKLVENAAAVCTTEIRISALRDIYVTRILQK